MKIEILELTVKLTDNKCPALASRRLKIWVSRGNAVPRRDILIVISVGRLPFVQQTGAALARLCKYKRNNQNHGTSLCSAGAENAQLALLQSKNA